LQGASEQDSEKKSPIDNSEKAKKAGQSVGLRWLTAAIAIPIVLLFAWFGGWIAFVGAAVVLIICLVEMYQMLIHAGYRPVLWLSIGLGFLFLIAAMLPAQRLLILEFGLGAAILVSLPTLFFRRSLDNALLDWALTLATTLYLGWSVSCFLLLRGSAAGTIHFSPGFSISIPSQVWWLLTLFLGVWGFDSAAFFSGRYFGRHKLAPNISPGKTWEGVIGGFVLPIIAALLFTVMPLGVPWYLAVILGILIGVAAVMGDLGESLIKRQTRVKDSGQIMPGHGGLLDRMDSLLFAAIVVLMFSQLLGK
jgi:phosphatidate cytidylyltransferase